MKIFKVSPWAKFVIKWFANSPKSCFHVNIAVHNMFNKKKLIGPKIFRSIVWYLIFSSFLRWLSEDAGAAA